VPSVSDFSGDAAEVLRGLGADPVLVGALAAMYFRATRRVTTDADFLVRDVAGIAAAFESRGLKVRVHCNEDGTPHLYMVRGGDTKVDVIVAGTAYQDLAMARAVDGRLAIEDVIVHKLIAWRPRDQDDIRSIMVAGHEMDRDYIAHWAAEWDISERWSEANTWE
jgi:hypothetical protein